MATRNFVPRADGEGSLGTETKRWGEVQTGLLHVSGEAVDATLPEDSLVKVKFSENFDGTQTYQYGLYALVQSSPAADQAANGLYGALIKAFKGGAQALGSVYGLVAHAGHIGTAGVLSATAALVGKVRLDGAVDGTGSITTASGLDIMGPSRTTGNLATIGTLYGVRVINQGAAFVTTSYGLKISAQSGATTSWAIYSEGGDSYHAGKWGLATTSPTAVLDVNSDILRLRTAKTLATAGDTGNAGDICWDSGYVYVCVATNTWKRAALSTW